LFGPAESHPTAKGQDRAKWKPGLKPIAFDQIGIRPNPNRTSLAQFETSAWMSKFETVRCKAM